MELRKGLNAVFLWARATVLAACLIQAAAAQSPIQSSGASESPVFWRLAAADGPYRIEAWDREPASPDASQTAVLSAADRISLVTADSTVVELVREMQPLAVIDELQIDVEVQSSRPGLSLVAEIVLPNSTDPASGQPRRAVVVGTSYTSPGTWQRLEVSGVPVELRRSVRTMQLTANMPIDTRGAYVSRMLLRIRPGRGETTLRIQDIRVRGAVEVEPTSGVTASHGGGGVHQTSGQTATDWQPPTRPRDELPQVELAGGVLHVQGAPIFPRAVEYFEGTMRQARELGFNILMLGAPPTREQEREAESVGMWLIAPPPDRETLSAASSMEPFGRVVAWRVGQRLTPVDLDATRQWASLVRRLDPVRGRPLLASVDHGQRAYSRVLDIVVLDRRPLCGAVPLARFALELDSEKRLALLAKAVWMTIQTQIPPEITCQAGTLAHREPQTLDSRLACDQVSRLTWMAVAHGMHGLIYESAGSSAAIDFRDPTTMELLLLSRQLELVEPLLVATGSTRRAVDLGGGIHAGILSDGRTHCVFPWRHDDFDQTVPPAEAPTDPQGAPGLSMVIAGVGEPSEARLVTTTDTARLTVAREAGGVRVATDSLLSRDFILLTQDATFARRVTTTVASRAAQMADLERALLSSEAIRVGAGGQLPAADGEGLRSARSALSALRRQSRINRSPQSILRSSPLDRFVALHEADLRLATIDRRSLPTPNLLAGGDFESVQAARQAGWQHIQLAGEAAAQDIEIVTGNARSGSYCVRIFTRSKEADGRMAIVAPGVWLTSPRVPLDAGDAIRISGWVRGGTDRVASSFAVIEDSLGGRPLSLRTSPSDQWQPFVMYRATDVPHEWTIRVASCGAGDVFFDGLAVQRVPADLSGQLTPSGAGRESRRVPFDSPGLKR